jgi:hypothetical protein
MPAVLEQLCAMLKSNNTAFEYSALGALKNLCITKENKATLLVEGVVAALVCGDRFGECDRFAPEDAVRSRTCLA